MERSDARRTGSTDPHELVVGRVSSLAGDGCGPAWSRSRSDEGPTRQREDGDQDMVGRRASVVAKS